VTEKSPSYEVDELPPLEKENTDLLPWETGPAARLIMDEMGISDKGGGVWMFEAKCVGFTMESKARPGEYEMVRGYQQFETDFHLKLPVYNAHQLVDDTTGNLELLSQAYRTIARKLDLDVFDMASKRLDQAVAAKDAEAAVKSQRFDAGKGVVAAKKKTGVTL